MTYLMLVWRKVALKTAMVGFEVVLEAKIKSFDTKWCLSGCHRVTMELYGIF